MISIDGAYGEGGGQVLVPHLAWQSLLINRYALSVFGRDGQKPGLAAQHLTAVRAAAAICQAEVRGDTLGSMTLEFIPGGSAQAGSYTFDVTQARQGGSAGTVTLVLQTILIPLALADW
jgi:RNA 3'-terminal phosphate cyclase (ATP)